MTSVLPDADWRAHHLINLAGLRAFPDLIHAAARAGLRTDDQRNVAPLPATAEAQEKLKAMGIDLPVHDNGHLNWNQEVAKRLEGIQRRLQKEGLATGSDAYAHRAEMRLEELQYELRQKMLGQRWLTQNPLPGPARV